MNRNSHSVFLTWLFLAATALMLSACASTPSDTASPEPQEPATAEVEPWDGHGLDIPLDGSSMDAWENSMARVQSHTTGQEYETLQRAIQWHLTYDLGAKRDMGLLISRLDGKTGNEIISDVRWIKRTRSKNVSDADTEASDSPQ